MKRMRWLGVTALLAVAACAQTRVYREEGGMRRETGVRYYTPKPYLFVKRDAGCPRKVISAAVKLLPDFGNPQYVTHRTGLGASDYTLTLNGGMLVTFEQNATAKGDEALTKAATALTDILKADRDFEKQKAAERAAEKKMEEDATTKAETTGLPLSIHLTEDSDPDKVAALLDVIEARRAKQKKLPNQSLVGDGDIEAVVALLEALAKKISYVLDADVKADALPIDNKALALARTTLQQLRWLLTWLLPTAKSDYPWVADQIEALSARLPAPEKDKLKDGTEYTPAFLKGWQEALAAATKKIRELAGAAVCGGKETLVPIIYELYEICIQGGCTQLVRVSPEQVAKLLDATAALPCVETIRAGAPPSAQPAVLCAPMPAAGR